MVRGVLNLLKGQISSDAGGPFVGPAGEFVSAAVRIKAATVSFDGNDFTEDLFGRNGFIKGAWSIAAKNKKESLVGGMII